MGTNDQSKLMVAIGMSDSLDSSSDDIIPMQRRKKRGFSRKRNSRTSSTSVFFKSNYAHSFCTLIKLTFVTIVIISLFVGMILMYSLSSRIDLLQLNINGLQSTKSDLPGEMHLIHSQLKSLDQNSTELKTDLTRALNITANLTSEIVQIRSTLKKITEALDEAPTIRQLPKDVDELKKIVADLGSKMSSDDSEVKLAKEHQANNEKQMSQIEMRLHEIEGNLSWVKNHTELTEVLQKSVTDVMSELNSVNSNIANLSSSLTEINRSQERLDEWRLAVQDRILTLNESSARQLDIPTSSITKSPKLVHSFKKDLFLPNTTDINM